MADNPYSVLSQASAKPVASPSAPPSSANPYDVLSGKPAAPSGGNPVLNAAGSAAGTVASGLGNILNAPLRGIRTIGTHETDPDKQREIIRKAQGSEPLYQALGKIPVVGHLAQGTMDTIGDTIEDPWNALSGPVKGATTVGEMGLRAMSATPVGRMMYDFLHWAGPVAREHGPQTVDKIREASHIGSATADKTQNQMVRMFDHVVEGKHVTTGKQFKEPLSAGERMNVARALNGDLDPKMLPAREGDAYRQLRRLTDADWGMRQKIAQKQAFDSLTKDTSEADKATLWKAITTGKELGRPLKDLSQKVEQQGPMIQQTRKKVAGEEPKAQVDWNAVYKKAYGDLTAEERIQVQRAAGRAFNPEGLSPKLADRLKMIQEAGSASLNDVHDFQGISVPSVTPKQKYTMPLGNQEKIDHANMLQDKYEQIVGHVEQQIPHRENYLPAAHQFGEDAAGTEARTVNRAERGDPRQNERPNVFVSSPEQLKTGFEAMGKNLGRQVDHNIIHDSLGDLLDHPEVKKLFDQHIGATGNKRTDWEKVKDAWRAAVGYPRAAVVSLTPRHGANILDLLVNAVDPQHVAAVMKDTMELAAKLVKATPKEYENLTKEGRQMGAQTGQFTERKPFFQTIPGTKIPLDLPGKIPEGIPLIGGRNVGLAAWSRANNKIVWAIDEAAKQTLAKHLQSIGELNPGAKASARLVDYSNTSPLVKALKWVAPFGSFRGSIPGAVLGGVARNPAAAAFKNRATGGLFFGDKPDQGQAGIETFNPTADVGRIFNYGTQGQGRFKRTISGLGDYVRGSLGAPPQAALGAAQDIAAPGGSDPRWAMRGQTWLPRYNKAGKLDLGFVVDSALGGVPEAQAMLEAAGIGRYQWAGLGKELLNQSTGVSIK